MIDKILLGLNIFMLLSWIVLTFIYGIDLFNIAFITLHSLLVLSNLISIKNNMAA